MTARIIKLQAGSTDYIHFSGEITESERLEVFKSLIGILPFMIRNSPKRELDDDDDPVEIAWVTEMAGKLMAVYLEPVFGPQDAENLKAGMTAMKQIAAAEKLKAQADTIRTSGIPGANDIADHLDAARSEAEAALAEARKEKLSDRKKKRADRFHDVAAAIFEHQMKRAPTLIMTELDDNSGDGKHYEETGGFREFLGKLLRAADFPDDPESLIKRARERKARS